MRVAGAWPEPDWYADPTRRHAMRWWDGEVWTARVTDGGAVFEDAVDAASAARLHAAGGDLRARWPLWVVAAAVTVLVATDVAVATVFRHVSGLSVPLLIALSAGALYGALVAMAVLVHRRVAPGQPFLEAYGLQWRWSDIGWGLVASLAARIAAVIVVIPIVLLGRDLTRSNVPAADRVHGRVGVLIALTLVAVVVAPIVEELFFRGIVQRSLEVSLPAWAAIAVASALFGMAHIDPHAGRSNLGLVAATATGGAVFGMVAHATKRLPPSMVAHALFNAVAIGFLWAVA